MCPSRSSHRLVASAAAAGPVLRRLRPRRDQTTDGARWRRT